MDTDRVLPALRTALALQACSVWTLTCLAGCLRGLAGAAVKESLRAFVAAEQRDSYLLVEKYSALGGELSWDLGSVRVDPDPATALADLVRIEQQTVAALHAVIAHSGQEPRSEALEHLLEHVIMRKQQQVDYLRHALADGDGSLPDPG